MATNYTAYPTAYDVRARLDAAGVTLRVDITTRATTALEEVIAEVERRTRRQFIADTIDNVRTFDGSGTATLDIDEIVSLTTVTIAGGWGTPAYDLSGAQMVQATGRPCSRLVVGTGSLPAYNTVGIGGLYRLFPAGRQNILVTGKWGYGEAIPADLWHGICGEAAVRMTREASWNQGGRISSESYGDEKRSYQLDEGEALGWHQAFEALILQDPRGYQRSAATRNLKKLRGPML